MSSKFKMAAPVGLTPPEEDCAELKSGGGPLGCDVMAELIRDGCTKDRQQKWIVSIAVLFFPSTWKDTVIVISHSFNNDHVYFDIMKNVPPIFLGTAQKWWDHRDPENAADVSVG
jgi:hypothetical protein